MTMRSEPGRDGEVTLPLPALFGQAKDITIKHLHRQLGEEGFGGIRYSHGSVFRFIDAEGSRLTVLAERSGLSKQAIGEVVGELERHGYVERTTDPTDQRAKIIRLTERGVKARIAAARILEQLEHRWARQLGGDRFAVLRGTLEEVLRVERDGQSGS